MMPQATSLEFLSDRNVRPLAVARGTRALTGEERDWLARVPQDALVERNGDADSRGRWAGMFFRSYVRQALERGAASVGIVDGVPVAWFEDREYRVILPAGASATGSRGATAGTAVLAHDRPAVATPRPLARRPVFSPQPFCPGTYASHSAPND